MDKEISRKIRTNFTRPRVNRLNTDAWKKTFEISGEQLLPEQIFFVRLAMKSIPM